LTTVDHKRIGVLYGASAIMFFLVGGFEALLIRTQLARPENGLVDQQRYNELFTMHGTTMIFQAIMPLSSAFFNFVVPLQIGARDVAFPRLNAFSYWTFLAGGLILNISWIANAAPDQGWYGYAPLTSKFFSPGDNVDYWALGLQVLGVASLAAAFNFIVTIFNMRAPGMTMMRMPMFTWTTLIVSILIVMAFPAITIALALLMLDRFAGTHFYAAYHIAEQGGQLIAAGGDPLLWQHLFWVFGHPEVYILVLPAFGIVSEVIPTFSRKPLFGYAVMVYATAAIAFLGFGVWVHHMFTTGLGPTPEAVFAGSTMLIAIPTGVKILNWTATMWGGSLSFTTPMLFAVGLVSQFTIGGLSGVMHAVVPVDTQHNDSYFVVAHFHYVLFGGSIFGLFAGIYYWWPKLTGRMLDEGLGKLHFWTQFAGFNLAFFPMHFLGLQGMPRRYSTYEEASGWWFWNVVATVGAYLIGGAVLLFLVNVARTLREGRRAGEDPWDAPTLEWSIPSPPPVYNFRDVPLVRHRDPLWIEKYGAESHGAEQELEVTIAGKTIAVGEAPDEAPTEQAARRLDAHDEHSIHLPNPSYYPLIAAGGILLAAMGLLVANPDVPIGELNLPVVTLGGLVVLVTGIYGWSFEPAG
jgi:cytochrome c oxidase subunit 1